MTIRKINPILPLRLGLGFMYLYSAYDIFYHPKSWYWTINSLPEFIRVIINNQIGIDNFLRMQSAGEFLAAVIFLAWFLPQRIVKLASGFAVIEFGLILTLVGINPIIFRDLGLFGSAAALFIFMPWKSDLK